MLFAIEEKRNRQKGMPAGVGGLVPPLDGYDVRFEITNITTVEGQQHYNDRINYYADRLT